MDTEFYTVWSGNTWREYPQPEVAAPTYYGKPERASQAGAAQQRYSAQELVYAVLANGGWHSVNGMIARTGLSDRRVRFVLMTGARDGTLERMDGAPVRPGLRPVFLYRRKQAAEAA